MIIYVDGNLWSNMRSCGVASADAIRTVLTATYAQPAQRHRNEREVEVAKAAGGAHRLAGEDVGHHQALLHHALVPVRHKACNATHLERHQTLLGTAALPPYQKEDIHIHIR